jgi:hypothetical protein
MAKSMIKYPAVLNYGEVLVNPDASALTFDLAANAAIVSDPDTVALDAGPDAVVLKFEYVIVDADKQTTRCAESSGPWEW